MPSLFGLAPGGVCRADAVASAAVRSCRTVSPLPRRNAWRFVFCGTFPWTGNEFPAQPGVIRHRYSVEPGLSSRSKLPAVAQPSDTAPP